MPQTMLFWVILQIELSSNLFDTSTYIFKFINTYQTYIVNLNKPLTIPLVTYFILLEKVPLT